MQCGCRSGLLSFYLFTLWCSVMWCILRNGWVTPVQSVMSDALCGSSASIHARCLQFFHALVS